MSLDLGKQFQRLLPDLNCTWVAFLADTGENCFAVSQDLDLTDVIAGVTAVLLILAIPDFSVLTRQDAAILGIWNVCDAKNRDVSNLEIKILLSLMVVEESLEVVEQTVALIAAVGEARIIFEPVNASDAALMTLADLVRRAIDSIEVVNVSVRSTTSSKHVTAVTKFDFAAMFERDLTVLLN